MHSCPLDVLWKSPNVILYRWYFILRRLLFEASRLGNLTRRYYELILSECRWWKLMMMKVDDDESWWRLMMMKVDESSYQFHRIYWLKPWKYHLWLILTATLYGSGRLLDVPLFKMHPCPWAVNMSDRILCAYLLILKCTLLSVRWVILYISSYLKAVCIDWASFW